MKTKHDQKIKKYRQQIDRIELQYHGLDIKSKQVYHDVIKLHELYNKLIVAEVEAQQCQSDNPNHMCSDCNCWKRTRMMCS